MKSLYSRVMVLGVAAGLSMFLACSTMPIVYKGQKTVSSAKLTAAEQIAGEIMAYLMEVVLGQAGNPQMRQAWATRGSELPLDFAIVKSRMFGPVPLRAELMVLDTNILGLSQVLYHYDRRLNLFKGTGEQDSLYPCAELMAIRLLLLHKLKRGERVSMAALIRQKALFMPGSRTPQPAELAEMNLTDGEFGFLKDVLQSEPAFFKYMEHPFLVSTLKRIGAAEQDTFTLLADQMANYRQGGRFDSLRRQSSATIAILPSMNTLFETTGDSIAPTSEYREVVNEIEQAIITGLEDSGRQWVGNKKDTIKPTFLTPFRPMVIHPQNAGRVIEDVCPKADFVVVVLGKNVYRAMDIDPDNDIYPHQRRIYLDKCDIRHQQIDDEIQSIVDAVVPLSTTALSKP